MSNTVSIEQASSQLARLVRGLGPDDEIILTDNDKPIARIVSDSAPRKRIAGTCKGMIEIIDDGDDVILDHFKEYLP
jgi:antitoxin (DNA-binding transcriptional repressor) of toxin-antitoxin stability system